MNLDESKKSKELKIALFGSGKMGLNHLKAIKLIKNAKVIAIADPNADAESINEIMGEKISIYSDASELLKNLKPDIIHIITPPAIHFKLAELALNNGAHIYVEKPFTLNLEEAEKLFKIANEKNLKICAGHQLLFQNCVDDAKNYLKMMGDIIHIESYFSFRTVRRGISPVDQILDILPHPVYTMLHFMEWKSDTENLKNIQFKIIDVEADGEARVLIQLGKIKAILVVTLNGRPVDSYLKIIGSNGMIDIDFVRGIIVNLLGPGADAIAAILSPYRQSLQKTWRSTKAFFSLVFSKHKNYAGLNEIIYKFYQSVLKEENSPLSPNSILGTVKICEEIGKRLSDKYEISVKQAKADLEKENKELPPVEQKRGFVLVTGGTGFLGKTIVRLLRKKGWPVRVISRNVPSFNNQVGGVEYAAVDLKNTIPPEILQNVSAVVHCAAETAGGQKEHEKNSIEATRNIMESSIKLGIKKLIHISSIAVLKTSKELGHDLDENSTLDSGNLGRGPYVWGKAESELALAKIAEVNGADIKIIRPGPLVDFDDFEAPGRLGREVGSRFIVMGGRKSKMSVCDINTVAEIIEYYLKEYNSAPKVLNVVEPRIPTRKELIQKLLIKRAELKPLYVPSFFVGFMSEALKLVQKIISPSKKPLDIGAAFASEKYNTELVGKIVNQARKIS